jgi:hypothetical protein
VVVTSLDRISPKIGISQGIEWIATGKGESLNRTVVLKKDFPVWQKKTIPSTENKNTPLRVCQKL